MTETPRAILERTWETAGALGDRHAADLIAALREQTRAARLRILLVGSTGSGRFSVANLILDAPDLLPISPVPKAPLGVTVRHGVSPMVEAVARDGSRTALPVERLRSFLTAAARSGSTGQGGEYVALDMTVQADVLRTSELRIESLEADRSLGAWKELLAGTDYTILVLNAAALLSEVERRFVRDVLVPASGLERVAVVINQMDLVPEEERTSIVELVQTFLGPFESKPLLVELSAARARRALLAGSRPEGDGYDALVELVRHDLVERHAALRDAAILGAAELCIAELEDAAARQRAVLSMTEDELRSARERIESQREWLERRIERAQQKIDIFVDTLIRERFFREVEDFGEMFRRRLPDEVAAVDDLATVRRHLPGYIETVWADFLSARLVAVRARLMEEIEAVGRMIEEDLSELLAGTDVDVRNLVIDLEHTSSTIHSFVMPKRGKHYASGVAGGLSLTGLVVLMFDLPLGLATLGAGYAVRTMFEKGISESEKKAIAQAGANATRELEAHIKREIGERFAELAENFKAEVARLYEAGLARVAELMEEGIARRHELDDRRGEVERIAREAVPDLRRMLERLDREEVTV